MALLRPASKLDQDDYDAAVAAGLTRVFEDPDTETRPVQLSDMRVVVISDLHRGARDGADDFERAEPAYSAALGHYLELRYQLWLLGDVEELWENAIDEVVPDSYRALLDLEAEYGETNGGPGLRRFFGNHDLDWKNEDAVDAHLRPHLPTGVRVQEGLKLDVRDGETRLGTLFFVHGHQGTSDSERFAFVSRWILRHVWRRIQKSQGWLSTSPSYDYELRAKHDTAMFRWARSRGGSGVDSPVVIAGHTHHPIFPGHPPALPGTPDVVARKSALDDARTAREPLERLAALRAAYEEVRAVTRRKRYAMPEVNDPPCYFNDGCCCYPDGDITCIEIDGAADEIRLVRWPREGAEPATPPLARDSLRSIFGRVGATR